MLILPGANSSALMHYWQGRYGNLGNLFSPFYFSAKSGGELKYKSFTPYNHLPYALDNGKFICYSHGIDWDKSLFLKHCEKINHFAHKPLWIVVPDEVGNGGKTLELFYQWHDYLRNFNVPLALAVQDGMTVKQVLQLDKDGYFDPQKDVIFVGGSTHWKLTTLSDWCVNFKRVHCARVNTLNRLLTAKKAGCESVDGTGWFRGDDYHDLEFFLKLEAGFVSLPKQYELFQEGK